VHACKSPWLWRSRVPHQLLHHLHVVTVFRQQRAVGVPEGMPADPLGNARPPCSGLQRLLQGRDRPDRHIPEDRGVGEDASSHLRPRVSLIRRPAVAQMMPMARSRSGNLPNRARNSSAVRVSGGLRRFELQRTIVIGFSCCPIHPQRIPCRKTVLI
jgi:hypothetical protein